MTTAIVVIYVIAAILAFGAGALGGFYFFRARHRESIAEMEELDRELAERDVELRRLRYQVSASSVHPQTHEQTVSQLKQRIETLQDELEQRELDLNILRQDYELETGILRQEIEQLRTAPQAAPPAPTRVETAPDDAERLSLRAELDEHQRRIETLQEELDRTRAQLVDTSARLKEREADVAELTRQREPRPPDPSAAAAESLLVKRLRQQIRLQAEELEQLRARVERSPRRPHAPPADAAPSETPAEPGQHPASAPEQAPGLPTFSPLSAIMGGDREARPPRGTGGPDPLTLLPGVTDDLQQRLYEMGLKTFEQIARLSSADVRRIADRLGVDRRMIQDGWIIEAQSQLFEQQTS